MAQEENKNRTDGWYWVKDATGGWRIALWIKEYGSWKYSGSNSPIFDRHFQEIDETPIERPKLCVAPNTSMTLQECKNKVANNHGYEDWGYLFVIKSSPSDQDELINEVAELYAASNRVEEKEAIGFAEWISSNAYEIELDEHNSNPNKNWCYIKDQALMGITELYSLYKTQKA